MVKQILSYLFQRMAIDTINAQLNYRCNTARLSFLSC